MRVGDSGTGGLQTTGGRIRRRTQKLDGKICTDKSLPGLSWRV